MKISYNWLASYGKKGLFSKKLPKASLLKEVLNAHAFEVESSEEKDGDTIFDIKVLADRAHYALCHRGIVREAFMLTNTPFVEKHLEQVGQKGVQEVFVNDSVKAPTVNVLETNMCQRYMARRIDNVSVGKSPTWLSERLEGIDARSINTIVDATNFVMFDIGQPLHAFDADKVEGDIVIRFAKNNEKIIILDGREIELDKNDLVIADDKGPIAIAGVKGGKRAEVTENTRSIILESAHFNPVSVRKTSTRLNLRNESSKRFENEITPVLAKEAMERVSGLILGLSKGISGSFPKVSEVTDIYKNPVSKWTIDITASYISSMIGVSVSSEKAKYILEGEGCEVLVTEDMLVVTPPYNRLDILIPADVVDEIARIEGYKDLPSKQTPEITNNVPSDTLLYITESIKDILVSLGFSEISTYTLVPKGFYEVSYPLASDKSALREKLIPKVSESLILNSRNADLLGLQSIRVFEIGRIFPKEGEKVSIALGFSQVKKVKGINAELIIKESIDFLIKELAQKNIQIGFNFTFEINGNNVVAESDISIPSSMSDEIKDIQIEYKPLKDLMYKPFSQYPYIVRDIAFFVPSSFDEGEVFETIKATVTKSSVIKNTDVKNEQNLLVKGPDLFDKFEKDGKVSYGFRMIFQSFERTLTDEEIETIMNAVYTTVKEKGWEVR